MKSLPAELINHCLDCLRRERYNAVRYDGLSADLARDLKSCALVSHAWRYFAQAHLFYYFYVFFTKAAVDDGRPLPVPQQRPHTLESLCDFLTSCPHIASSIRVIDLQSDSRVSRIGKEDETGPEHPVDQAVLLTVLSLLPHLRTLILSGVILENALHRDLQDRPPIERLELRYDSLFAELDAEDVGNLLSTFSCIKSFSLYTIADNQAVIPSKTSLSLSQQPVEIKYMELDDIRDPETSTAMADIFSSLVQVDRVRCLDANCSFPALHQKLVDILSHELNEIRIPLRTVRWEEDVLPALELDISSCRNLRTLWFYLRAQDNSTGARIWDVSSLCSRISPARRFTAMYRHLRKLVINIFQDTEQVAPQTFEPLDEALASLVQQSSMENIVFVRDAVGRDFWEVKTSLDFAKFIHKSFPLLSRNKMICIQEPSNEY